MGDFVGGALGGGDPVHVGSGGAEARGSTMGRLDGQLPCMEGHYHVKELFTSPFSTYSAHDHSEGDCLFNQADPTWD